MKFFGVDIERIRFEHDAFIVGRVGSSGQRDVIFLEHLDFAGLHQIFDNDRE